MKKYGLQGKLCAQTGKGKELAAILLEAAQLVAREAQGCHLYIVSQDAQDEDVIWITEVWDSKEDHDDSLKLDSVRALIGKAMPIIDGPPERGVELAVLGGVVNSWQ